MPFTVFELPAAIKTPLLVLPVTIVSVANNSAGVVGVKLIPLEAKLRMTAFWMIRAAPELNSIPLLPV